MMRIIALLDAVGTALLLQLAFFATALLGVTLLPAAVALQRSFADQRAGEKVGFGRYFAHFRDAWRQYWPAAVIFFTLVLGAVVALLFWSQAPTPLSVAAVGILAVGYGAVAATYLALLHTADSHRMDGWRIASRHALEDLVRRPLRGLGALALLSVWLLLLGFVPTLVLVGSGIVPAIVTAYCFRNPRPDNVRPARGRGAPRGRS